jgi:hypothetical protein
MRGQFRDIVEHLQLRCDTRAQQRKAPYINAVSGRRNDVLGFDSPHLAIPRREPYNGSVIGRFGSFDLIASQERDLVNASAQKPAPGGAEKAFDEPILHPLRKVVEYERQVREESRLPPGPDPGYWSSNSLSEGSWKQFARMKRDGRLSCY